MRKKKQKQSNTASSGASIAALVGGGDNLESTVNSHSEFFDRLIELIPVRFYLPNDDADSKPWYGGLSKAAKASWKQQSKQNLKLARRNRFDPDNDPSTLHHLQQQQIDKEQGILGEDGKPGSKPLDLEGAKETSVTYEELREKLRRKIQAVRGNRGEKKADGNKSKNDRNKRKRGSEGDGGNKSGKGVPVDDNDDDDGEEIIEYGKVKLGDEDDSKQGKKNKKRKLSKAKELERAKKSQEVKKENPYVAERESWKAATSRAMGVKVHDDPRLIKESMKRETRKKAKNAEKWKERVEAQEKSQEERQRKRKENIEGRIHDKKMRKIAKREKKLMRPGFEGRKEGFITDV